MCKTIRDVNNRRQPIELFQRYCEEEKVREKEYYCTLVIVLYELASLYQDTGRCTIRHTNSFYRNLYSQRVIVSPL